MSDNPFESPPASNPYQGTPGKAVTKKPGTLTAIGVICLILGCFGLLSVCGTGIGFAMQGMAESIIDAIPDDDPQMEFQRANLDAQRQLMIPSLLVSAVNLFVALGLLIGGIGVLQSKESLRGILRLSLFGAIGYGVLKIGLAVFSTFKSMAAMDVMVNNPEFAAAPGGAEGAEAVASIARAAAIGGMAFAIVLALALMGFYLWAAMYINKPEVVKHFK